MKELDAKLLKRLAEVNGVFENATELDGLEEAAKALQLSDAWTIFEVSMQNAETFVEMAWPNFFKGFSKEQQKEIISGLSAMWARGYYIGELKMGSERLDGLS